MFPFGFASINPKALEDDVADDDKDQLKPFACLKKREGQTYCGRDVQESREYVFNDAAYAMQHYRRSRTIAVCNKCAERAEREGVGAGQQHMAPMALRGIRENDK